MPNLTSQLLIKLIDGVSGPARKAAGALANIGNVAKRINGAQARVANAIEQNNRALDAARGRMMDAAAMGYALARSLTAPVKAGIDFQTQLEDIGQKADIPQEKLAALGARIRKVAADTTQAASQMAKGMDTLVGFGASEDDALAMLRPIGRAATAYNAQIEDLSQASYAALLNLKVPADQVATALDAMAQAGKSGAFELKDMARYAPAIFAAYQGLGQKGVPAVADLAAAMQVVRMGAGDSAEAATNLSNVLQKINAPATRKKFAKMGVNLEREMKKAAEKGMTPIEAIAEITNRTLKGDLGKLGDLFEDAQVQKGLRAIIQNVDEYRKIRAEALKAQGVVEEDYARRLKTTQGYIQRFRNTIENLNTSLGTALLPTINEIADRLAGFAARLAEFAEKFPNLTRNVILAGSALISFRVAAAALSWAGLQAKGAILQIAAAALAAAGGMWKFTAALAGFVVAPVIAAFNGLRTAMIGYAAAASVAGHGTALAMMGRSLLSLLNPLRLVTAAMHLLKVAIIGNPIGIALAAIAAAGTWIYNNWNGIAAMFSGIADGFAKGLGPAAKFLEPVATFTRKIFDAVSGLLGPLDATEAQWRAWGETIGGTVASAVNAVANGIGRLVGLFTRAIEGAYAFGRAVKSWTGWGGGDAPAAPAPAISGARAKGGPIWPGGAFLVGEQGPEIVTPSKHGYVHPTGSGVGGAGGSGVTINQTFAPVFNGITDTDAILRKMGRQLADATSEALRGVQADYGFKFT